MSKSLAEHLEELQRRGQAMDKRLRDLLARHRYDLMATQFEEWWECAGKDCVVFDPGPTTQPAVKEGLAEPADLVEHTKAQPSAVEAV